MKLTEPRVALHLEDGSCRLLDPATISWLEVNGEVTWIHTDAGERIRDRRDLDEITERLGGWGFVRIHGSFAVNLSRVSLIRVCQNGKDLEVELDAPDVRVLPVSDMGRRVLWEAVAATEG